MRHALANALYRLAGRLDRMTAYQTRSWDGLQVGDTPPPWGASPPGDTATIQLHTRDDSIVSGSFKADRYSTYASLQVGSNPSVLLFLTRRSTRKLLDTIRGMDDLFCKYGEEKP